MSKELEKPSDNNQERLQIQETANESFRLVRGVDILPHNSHNPQQLKLGIPAEINIASSYDNGSWLD